MTWRDVTHVLGGVGLALRSYNISSMIIAAIGCGAKNALLLPLFGCI